VKSKDGSSQPNKGAADPTIAFPPGKFFRTPNIPKALKAVEAFHKEGFIEFEKHDTFLAVSVIETANVFWIRRRIEQQYLPAGLQIMRPRGRARNTQI
jgi:hypothetical protein